MNDSHHVEIVFNHADSVPRKDMSHSAQYLIINGAGDYDVVRGALLNKQILCYSSSATADPGNVKSCS